MQYVTKFDSTIELPKNFYLSKQIKDTFIDIENTKNSILLSGRAGTGKSTFLEFFKSKTKRKFITLAFTGVTAIKGRGRTIHSFFEFPPRILSEKGDFKILRHNKFIKELDLIIIDEISMVRADLLDAIDKSLKLNRKNDLPFGGVQMFFVGDIFQLSPVVKGSELNALNHIYPDGYWFFNSLAFKSVKTKFIQFEKVYRQKDLDFIRSLELIRENHISEKVLNFFNQRVTKEVNNISNGLILLAPTNKRTFEVNLKKLNSLQSEEFTFNATIKGKFLQSDMPTEKHLKLKVNAQIMMIKNDSEKRWVNGTIGIIEKLEKDKIFVKINKRVFLIEKVEWEKHDYKLKKGRYEPIVIGSFTQYPIKLAWAATIHKCQGQTFEQAIIDLHDGTFAHGMAYVALSRVKSIQGLFLSRPLRFNDIKFDERIYNLHRRLYLI